jgi:hypothetical protein
MSKRERVIRKKEEREGKGIREKEATKSSSLFPKIAIMTITRHVLLYRKENKMENLMINS